MHILSPAFTSGAPIPPRFTCEGDDTSPEIRVQDVPPDAQALALIMDDPDAPSGTFTHWTLWNVPVGVDAIPEGISGEESVRVLEGARQGTNDFGNVGYGGPCPPPGDGDHRYRFRLIALDQELELPAGAEREEVDRALEGHVLADAHWQGLFRR